MEAAHQKKTSRGEALRAGAYAVALVWINTYICRDMFFGSTAFMGSMHGFWTAIATRAGSSWFHAAWWPFWDFGIPFEWTYPPLVPALAAAISALRGVAPAVGFHSVTGLFYILAPVSLFFGCWRLMRSPGYSFLAALFYSLTSITQILVPDGPFSPANFFDARRLYVVTVWDDTPHLAALTFLPLVILFLARSIETRRLAYCAGAAASIAGAALASAFGPVMAVMAAICLLFVLHRERWPGNALLVALIGAWGWAIAAPFLSPSLMLAIRQATAESAGEGWSVGSLTALAVVILGWAILWHFLRKLDDWRAQFFVLFAWLTSSLPLIQLVLHRHFLPQPNRYKFEMEIALAMAIVFGFRPWIDRLPVSVRRAAVLVVLALAAEQVTSFRQQEKKFTFPQPVTDTIEYRAAMWAQAHFPTIRYFLPGSIAQWANAFTDLQQFTGESFTMATNQVHQRADTAIGFGVGDVGQDAHVTLTWLKAYGVGVIAISGRESQEYWRAFGHPEKFDGVLPALWSEGGVTFYRVPLREFTLAHIVPEWALVKHAPREPEDVREVERYVAGLDDPALPGTAFEWEGRNRIRIRTTAAPGQAVSVQVTYHPGWHAKLSGRPVELHRDGLGLMWLKPGVTGPCEILLDYDGGWELRLCRWLSWVAIAGLAAVLLLRLRALA
ncbi:MAG TPA: hypothetical protein VMS37_09225 [Verrucomicrobiae bacterium]|nr:hypothetical protein [Verrucomicrobiae bacterium]